jgi:hypothetical protein
MVIIVKERDWKHLVNLAPVGRVSQQSNVTAIAYQCPRCLNGTVLVKKSRIIRDVALLHVTVDAKTLENIHAAAPFSPAGGK